MLDSLVQWGWSSLTLVVSFPQPEGPVSVAASTCPLTWCRFYTLNARPALTPGSGEGLSGTPSPALEDDWANSSGYSPEAHMSAFPCWLQRVPAICPWLSVLTLDGYPFHVDLCTFLKEEKSKAFIISPPKEDLFGVPATSCCSVLIYRKVLRPCSIFEGVFWDLMGTIWYYCFWL